jgi:hypothetical protein
VIHLGQNTQRVVCGSSRGKENRLSSKRSLVHCAKGVDPMQLELTAVFKKVPEGYIGFVEELPGANTQGRHTRRSTG